MQLLKMDLRCITYRGCGGIDRYDHASTQQLSTVRDFMGTSFRVGGNVQTGNRRI